MKIFLDNLEKLMQAQKIRSKRAFAQKVGINYTTVYQWFIGTVTGMPNGEHLQKICAYFDVSLSDLLRADFDPAAGATNADLDDVTAKIVELLKGLPLDRRRDVLKYAEKEKLLLDFLKDKKEAG